MRKLIVSEFVSLDGVMEAPGPDGSGFAYEGWTVPYVCDEFMKFKREELFAGGALLLGRITYDGFAAAWPKMNQDDFGQRMNSLPKYVVSSTLQSADWQNSHVVSGDVATEVTKLKAQDGQDVLVFGSGQLLQTLIVENLVDEYRLLVYPVVLGTGKKLFRDGTHTELKLMEVQPFPTGTTLLRYEPKN